MALSAIAAATVAVAISAGPASAECTFVPPWPPITEAIRSARAIVIGRVVTDFAQDELDLGPDQSPRDYALQVTEVLRGDIRPGDLVDVQYLLPNWPWAQSFEGELTYPSCTSLRTTPGEVIAIAFDALQPAGVIHGPDSSWLQPPTRYHAMGVITAAPLGDIWPEREVVTVGQLRTLAALPPTDAEAPTALTPTPGAMIVVLATVVGVLLGAASLRRR